MGGCLKFLLVATLIVVVIGVIVGVSGVVWFRKHGKSILEEGQKSAEQGSAYGEGKQADECIGESLRRLKQCSTLTCQIQHKVFLNSCLEKATRPPEFCRDVPKQTEFTASARWALAECKRRGMENDQPCANLMQAVQTVCHTHRTREQSP